MHDLLRMRVVPVLDEALMQNRHNGPYSDVIEVRAKEHGKLLSFCSN